MPKYLAVAEKVYKNIKKDDLFTNDLTQNLNCLISQIRKAIKGTEFKLKFNYIDFDEQFDPSQNNGQYFPLKIT